MEFYMCVCMLMCVHVHVFACNACLHVPKSMKVPAEVNR